jgi:glycerate kinase
MTKDVALIPGGGAAGGVGAGLIAFCDARLEKGIEIILGMIKVDDYLKGVDLVITGEGQIDGQSVYGKTPVGIANHAAKYNIPTIAIAGSLGEGIEEIYRHNIDSAMTIVNGPMSLADAKEQVIELMETATERTIRLLNVGIKMECQI